MNYLLAVLSHGDPGSPTVERTLESFHEHVTPRPHMVIVQHDGPGMAHRPVTPEGAGFIPFAVMDGQPQKGFCGATRELWRWATAVATHNDCPYVFWLEHDFTFDRDVDLTRLAEVLRSHPTKPLDGWPMLFQMSLMRDAANDAERAAGGLYASRMSEFKHRHHYIDPPSREWLPWMEHTSYFTTTPSLMRTVVMQANPFGAYRAACEGQFGLDLVSRGYSFGVWGDGSPWVSHIGERTGIGY